MEDVKNFDVETNGWKLGGSNLKLECVACSAEDSVEVSADIKQEDCVDFNHDANLGNFVNVKPDTEDCTVQNLVFYNESKEELKSLCCEICGGDYDFYCTKCPMLVRIFDANIPTKVKNRIKQTLPKDFFDIREIYPGDIGIIALKTVPQGVTFGPFQGLVPIIVDNTSKWKVNMGKLDYLKDPRCLNWMQYIRYSEDLHFQNLMPFQHDNQLFYQSTRLIEEGEELLVWFKNGNTKDNDYIQLSVKEKLEDVYACVFCCLGFNSATFLLTHNTVCPWKKDKNLFFTESPIVQCTFCKIYLLESEYSEIHLGHCCTRKAKLLTARSRINENDSGRQQDTWKRKRNDGDLTDGVKKHDCSLCEYETANKFNFMRHLYTHSETRLYRCPKCPYRSKTKYYISDHLRRKHVDRVSAFDHACPLCSERFKSVSLLQFHITISHDDNRSFKCPKCQFRTSNKKLFLRHHRSAHVGARPYRCHSCPKRFACEKSLRLHVNNQHVDANLTKRFKCPKCDRFETKYEASLRKHLLTVHGGVKRFRCGVCPFATMYKHSLARHLYLHREDLMVEYECADSGENRTRDACATTVQTAG